MKLTWAQDRALRAVEKGAIEEICISGTQWYGRPHGAKISVVRRLVDMGLVKAPCVSFENRKGLYTLTAAGKRALEALK